MKKQHWSASLVVPNHPSRIQRHLILFFWVGPLKDDQETSSARIGRCRRRICVSPPAHDLVCWRQKEEQRRWRCRPSTPSGKRAETVQKSLIYCREREGVVANRWPARYWTSCHVYTVREHLPDRDAMTAPPVRRLHELLISHRPICSVSYPACLRPPSSSVLHHHQPHSLPVTFCYFTLFADSNDSPSLFIALEITTFFFYIISLQNTQPFNF